MFHRKCSADLAWLGKKPMFITGNCLHRKLENHQKKLHQAHLLQFYHELAHFIYLRSRNWIYLKAYWILPSKYFETYSKKHKCATFTNIFLKNVNKKGAFQLHFYLVNIEKALLYTFDSFMATMGSSFETAKKYRVP